LESTKMTFPIERVEKSRLSGIDFDNLPFGSVFSDHMLCADYRDGHWEEPCIVPYGPLKIPPSMSALHYGQSIFEGFKAHRLPNERIALFRPRENFTRFNRSAERLAMPDIPESLFLDGITELVRLDREWIPRTEEAGLYIRPVYFGTDEALVVRPAGSYRFVVFTCPVGQYFAEPLRLLVEEHFVRAFPGGTGFTKAAGNYAGSLLAGRLAQERGFHNVIWLDGLTRKLVEESGLMNIFFVIDGKAITPPLSGTILPGVVRDSVITLLREMKVKVDERPIGIEDVVSAHKENSLSEAFAVGTAATVAPIETIRYRTHDVQLPPRTQQSLAERVREKLVAIRSGLQPDIHGWLMEI
jgi:branched-chain amino acid aminotransferase